jgi:hypothetical protein
VYLLSDFLRDLTIHHKSKQDFVPPRFEVWFYIFVA